MINQLEHILQAIRQFPIDESTCVIEFQAHTSLRPDLDCGLHCPYPDKINCERYKKISATETRFAHLRLYVR
jgi:hypothetical protein